MPKEPRKSKKRKVEEVEEVQDREEEVLEVIESEGSAQEESAEESSESEAEEPTKEKVLSHDITNVETRTLSRSTSRVLHDDADSRIWRRFGRNSQGTRPMTINNRTKNLRKNGLCRY
jgi:hypothetical protein